MAATLRVDMKDIRKAQGARLTAARMAAGYRSAREAALANGWPESTYRAHEAGSRTIGQDDAARYARRFGGAGVSVSARSILFGDEGAMDTTTAAHFIPIMGRVGAGGDVEPDMEQVPEEGLEQIELPGSAMIARTMVADPIGFRVVGDSMYPRFRDGDILVVEREQPWSIDRMIGDEAVILTVDSSGRSRRLVKRIMPGRRAHTYSLISLKDDTPPILDARIRWASPVRVIIPDIGLRVRPIPHQRPARRAGSS